VIDTLSRDMIWVAAPLQVVGILYGVGAVVCVIRAFRDPHYIFQAVLIGFAMLFFLALGTWTSTSARSFREIVSTQGRDINHLMVALKYLQKMYGLLSLVVKVYFVVAVVSIVVGLIAALVAAFTGS
jgi:hypothetical protein